MIRKSMLKYIKVSLWGLIFPWIMVTSCAPQPFLLSDHQQFLVFGDGGGFTGQIRQYYMLPSGQVYYSNNIHQPPEYIKKVSKDVFAQIVSNIHALNMINHQVAQPGNVFKLIEYHTAQATYKWLWQSKEDAPNAQLIYNNFKQLINE
ncbi:hypothetical protein [Membranihabitans marinus]|uniref:hypothetical protein n=1 Tax=Membranihabitans marinus TaxID=1227546 RepID=UPI001F3D6CE4|nr:hypothetical protein [Membranihabitans marinus]